MHTSLIGNAVPFPSARCSLPHCEDYRTVRRARWYSFFWNYGSKSSQAWNYGVRPLETSLCCGLAQTSVRRTAGYSGTASKNMDDGWWNSVPENAVPCTFYLIICASVLLWREYHASFYCICFCVAMAGNQWLACTWYFLLQWCRTCMTLLAWRA